MLSKPNLIRCLCCTTLALIVVTGSLHPAKVISFNNPHPRPLPPFQDDQITPGCPQSAAWIPHALLLTSHLLLLVALLVTILAILDTSRTSYPYRLALELVVLLPTLTTFSAIR